MRPTRTLAGHAVRGGGLSRTTSAAPAAPDASQFPPSRRRRRYCCCCCRVSYVSVPVGRFFSPQLEQPSQQESRKPPNPSHLDNNNNNHNQKKTCACIRACDPRSFTALLLDLCEARVAVTSQPGVQPLVTRATLRELSRCRARLPAVLRYPRCARAARPRGCPRPLLSLLSPPPRVALLDCCSSTAHPAPAGVPALRSPRLRCAPRDCRNIIPRRRALGRRHAVRTVLRLQRVGCPSAGGPPPPEPPLFRREMRLSVT